MRTPGLAGAQRAAPLQRIGWAALSFLAIGFIVLAGAAFANRSLLRRSQISSEVIRDSNEMARDCCA